MLRALGAFAVLGLVLFATINSLAQQRPHVAAPHKPIIRLEPRNKALTPPVHRSMVGGLWMIDGNFKSSIYIKNNLEAEAITVHPNLYLSNGTRYKLSDVTLDPSGIAIISINDELAKQGVSSSATLSGYLEVDYDWAWDPFCITIRNLDTVHSLIFTSSLRSPLPPDPSMISLPKKIPTNTAESMWWKQEPSVTGFISVANLSPRPAHTTLLVTDSQGKSLALHDVTVTPHGMKLVQLPELLSTDAKQGGILVTSSETTDQLAISGGLEDPSVGYSSNLVFTVAPDDAAAADFTIAELGLMIGPADPMMAFPTGTTFTPYSVLRNTSDSPIAVTPTLWWMSNGSAQSAQLAPVSIVEHQTQSIDLTSAMVGFGPKNFSGSFNVTYEYTAKSGSILFSSGSVDQTNSYVFEVLPRGIQESAGSSIQYWSTGNGDDTMVSVWNPADEPQDYLFTLAFAGGHYALPLHLEARATRTFNVSEIIQNQVPDSEGNVIPAAIHEGSAVLSGSHAPNEQILVAADVSVYNVKRATCYGQCQQCPGYTGAVIVDSSFTTAVGGMHQETLIGNWYTGSQANIGQQYSSNNTPVATADSGTGLVTGVSAGSATISGSSGFLQVYIANLCGNPPQCPTTNFGGTAPGTIASVAITGADIEANDVDVTLSGPSGTSGTLTIIVNGSPNNKPQFMANGGAAIGPGQYQIPLNRPSLLSADTYASVTADWNVGGSTLPTTFNLSRKWIVRGTIRHSQYNVMNESACTVNTQTAYLYTSSCQWQTVTLRSQFVSQAEINGTGISLNYGVLKYDDGRCASSYPQGANSGNSFLKVSSVTGQCNTALVGGDSVATNPGPFYSNPYGCGDNLQLVNSSNQNSYLKHVADQCANTTQGCADGHMDNFNSTPACSGVGDLPGSPYWTVDDQ